MNSLQSTLLVMALIVAMLEISITTALHIVFLRVLFSVHPELWREYKSITFNFREHWTVQHRKLKEVYKRITEPKAIKARQREIIYTKVFAISLFLAVIAFGISRFF